MGPTDGDMNPADAAIAEAVRPGIAMGRYGTGADAVAYLAGPGASFVTGTGMLAAGGLTA
ncbi:hypothetical protein [Massilia rubra]|uniref:SDR family oxidoreductase n=1 Tax=Massilia rubra TaxID=2607910 RepID=A0ABX0LJH3_9BURK|nr:hypothetical protein [Massilia rubra]NHZ34993.1 hypothetical protein [Massilia rubra]